MDIINDAKRIAWNVKAKKLRKDEMKKAIKKKVEGAMRWTVENADLIAFVSPFIIYGTKALISGARNYHRTVNLNKEKQLKELYCYDRSLGHYWELRRKLTNREWIDINKRMREGKKLGEILQELKVLK